MLGPLVLLHAPQAHANGTRGDYDYTVAILTQLVGCLDYEREVGQQWLVGLFVYNRRRAWEEGKTLC